MSPQDFSEQLLPIKDKLFRFAMRFMKNASEAEDIVQEVFLKMWTKRHNIHQYTNLEAWCMTLTKNLSIDKLKSKHRDVTSIPERFEMAAHEETPDRAFEIKESVERIRRIMDQLPEKQKTAIHLRDIEGLTYKEVAGIMDISMDQVKSNLFRARKKIKTQLINVESYGL